MKVKIAELKTNLSKYVQSVRDGGPTIEVCVREETVAYLVPAKPAKDPVQVEREELARKLKAAGITVTQWGEPGKISEEGLPPPGRAGDGKVIANTIVAMRAEKDW